MPMKQVPWGEVLRATAADVVGTKPSLDTCAVVARVPMKLVTGDEWLHAAFRLSQRSTLAQCPVADSRCLAKCFQWRLAWPLARGHGYCYCQLLVGSMT